MLRQHPLLTLATVAYSAVVCWVVLGTAIGRDGNAVTGVLLFAPLGALLVMLLGRRRWAAALFFGVVACCWINLANNVWLSGRVATPVDVLANAVGVILGAFTALLVLRVNTRLNRQRSEAHSPVSQKTRQG